MSRVGDRSSFLKSERLAVDVASLTPPVRTSQPGSGRRTFFGFGAFCIVQAALSLAMNAQVRVS